MDLIVQSENERLAELALSGPLTQVHIAAAAEQLSGVLGLSAFNRIILLDLNQTDCIDSSGVNWLLTTHRRTRENGGRLVLHSLPPLVDNVLKVLRMNLVFEIASSVDEARRLTAEGTRE